MVFCLSDIGIRLFYMGCHFETVSGVSRTKKRFFFSLADLNEALGEDPPNRSLSYLSLGDTMADWYKATAELAKEIYGHLIEDSKDIFYGHTGYSFSRKQIEILVGHLCWHLARRIARSQRQILLVDPASGDLVEITEESIQSSVFELPSSTREAMKLLTSDDFGGIVDFLATQRLFQTNGSLSVEMTPQDIDASRTKAASSGGLVNRVYLQSQALLRKWSSNNSIFVLSPYLGRLGMIWLHVLLGQVPPLLEARPVRPCSSKTIGRVVTFEYSTSIRDHAKSLLRCVIPTHLLENLDETVEFARNIGFPRKPTVTFTANAFFYDDEFQANLAVSSPDSYYIVGQHGNFGHSKNYEPGPELDTCDLFLSWGWTRDGHKVLPFGQIKPRIRGRYPKKLRGLTLFLRDEYDTFTYVDMARPNITYITDVIELCRRLNGFKIKTELRLHVSSKIETIEKLNEGIQSLDYVSISSSRPSLGKLVRSGQGIVFTYDSTGMLEMSASELPFFAFVPDGLELVHEEFNKNYESLANAGLLAHGPSHASTLLVDWMGGTESTSRFCMGAVNSFAMGLTFIPKFKVWKLRSLLMGARKLAR